jgi:cell wall-associated NlpC family hydrolase
MRSAAGRRGRRVRGRDCGADTSLCKPMKIRAVQRCQSLISVVAAAMAAACGPAGSVVATPSPFPRAGGVRDAPRPPRPATALPRSVAAAGVFEAQVLDTALGLRGIAYRLGGEDPVSGFDCSGFVRYVFALHHLDIPRTMAEQFAAAQDVAADRIQAGDLLFFSTIGPGPTHVGIALGPGAPGEFVHAPGTGRVVRLEHYDTPYWQSRFLGVKRPRR